MLLTDKISRKNLTIGVGLFLMICLVLLATVGYLLPRSEPLLSALDPLIQDSEGDAKQTAALIVNNFKETRSNSIRWSSVYWGFTFMAATLSALAGLILKFECFIKREPLKKDLAATMAVSSAILITLSTSGDFQRKWHANRLASAEIEQLGYQFLVEHPADANNYISDLAAILYRRQLSVVGKSETANTQLDQ